MSFAKTQKHEKTSYCCGLGTNMLNNFEVTDMVARDKCFNRTVNVHSNNHQESYKGDEKN